MRWLSDSGALGYTGNWYTTKVSNRQNMFKTLDELSEEETDKGNEIATVH